MSSSPLSIVILTHNNPDILRKCIDSALSLDYPEYEVIVVDNGSTDDTAAIVESEFGSRVNLIVREQNSPCAARNQGFWAAQGEFIVSLDHDMIIPDARFLHKAAELLRAHERVGLLSARICGEQEPDRALPGHWWYPTPIEEQDRFFYTTYFPEGAAIFRKEALVQVGGYDERFFHAAENIDLAFKLVNQGWQILYCPTLSAVELVVSGHVSHRRTKSNYYSLRNRLWIAWKYYSWPRAFVYAAPRVAVDGLRSLRYGWFDYFLSGLAEGISAPTAIREERRPLSSKQWAERHRIEGAPVARP